MERFAVCIKFSRFACDGKREDARGGSFARIARFRFTRVAGFDGIFNSRTARVLRIAGFMRVARVTRFARFTRFVAI